MTTDDASAMRAREIAVRWMRLHNIYQQRTDYLVGDPDDVAVDALADALTTHGEAIRAEMQAEVDRVRRGDLSDEEVIALISRDPKRAGTAMAVSLRLPQLHDVVMRLKAERDAIRAEMQREVERLRAIENRARIFVRTQRGERGYIVSGARFDELVDALLPDAPAPTRGETP